LTVLHAYFVKIQLREVYASLVETRVTQGDAERTELTAEEVIELPEAGKFFL